MKRSLLFVIKVLYLTFAGSLLLVGVTDADLADRSVIPQNTWAAATLDFSNRDTANNNPSQILFNVSDIKPGGFQVQTTRVKEDGDLGFEYSFDIEKTAGDDLLCDVLNLKVYKEWDNVYEGRLIDFGLVSNLTEKRYDDWIFVLSLPENAGDEIKSKVCDFNIKISTRLESGFSDEEILSNHVSG